MKEKYIRPCVETIVMVPEPCMAANSPATQTTDKTTGITSGGSTPKYGGDGDGSDMGAKRHNGGWNWELVE